MVDYKKKYLKYKIKYIKAKKMHGGEWTHAEKEIYTNILKLIQHLLKDTDSLEKKTLVGSIFLMKNEELIDIIINEKLLEEMEIPKEMEIPNKALTIKKITEQGVSKEDAINKLGDIIRRATEDTYLPPKVLNKDPVIIDPVMIDPQDTWMKKII